MSTFQLVHASDCSCDECFPLLQSEPTLGNMLLPGELPESGIIIITTVVTTTINTATGTVHVVTRTS